MITNREIIASVRKGLNESTADTTYTNKFIYLKLREQAAWLNRREASDGKLYKNISIFQTAFCLDVIKTTAITNCCSVRTNCVLYRTRKKFDDMWEDGGGPIVRSITSIDNSESYTYISIADWMRKQDNPYNKSNNEQYVFYDGGYFWFPKKAPKKINIAAYFNVDVSDKYICNKTDVVGCRRFLDKKFYFPESLQAELVSKTLEGLYNTKKIPEDIEINKVPNK